MESARVAWDTMRLSKKASRLLILAGGLLFLALFVFKARFEMADFEVNYNAGKRLWLAETLYRTVDEHYQFKYPPFSALIYLPLSFLPLSAAKAIWYVLILLCIGLVLCLSSKLVDPGAKKRHVLIALSGAVLAKFLLRELQLGQINALISALLILMVWVLVRDEKSPSPPREFAAGIFWGLATALKPYALIFFPYFMLKKKWRSLWPGFLFLALSLLMPTAFYGLPGNMVVLREWMTSLSHSTPALLNSQDNVSLLAFLVKSTGDQHLSTLIYGAALGCLAFLVLVFIGRGKKIASPLLGEAALLLVLIPLVSPLGWDYTFLSSILAVALVFKDFYFFPRLVRIILVCNFLVIALSIYDLLGRKLYAVFMSWSVLTINFFVLVAALFYLRFERRR
jgi:alpha-1,2-mannosyltransferase